MWDRIRIRHFQPRWLGEGIGPRVGRRTARQPLMEVLEDRQMLTATLQPISNLTVPAQQGETLPLLAATGATDAQNYTVTSSNPAIAATIATGDFWTLNVTYTDPSNSANDFSGPLTFQLISNSDLTATTSSMIEQFTNAGYYNNTGKFITRVATGFPGATDYVVQGGAPTADGTGSSNQPGTPFLNQNFQQLAYTGTDQLSMANAGGTDTNDTQFFITTGSPNQALGYNYTIFGQMVTGQSTLAKLTQIPVTENPNLNNEDSLPVNSPIYTASLSTTNPNGVLILDTTQATAGQTSTVTVTATDPTDGTTTSQSFLVTVNAYAGPTDPSINFRPFANPTTASTTADAPTTVTLNGTSGYPDTSVVPTLTYALASQPADGTVSNFNSATGTFTYTPDSGFQGTDTLNYTVTQTIPSSNTTVINGPNGSPVPQTSNAGTVTITVGPSQPVVTGAVRVVGNTLIVTPVPRTTHGTNYIDVIQVPSTATSSTPVIEVYVNNQLDSTQPLVSNLDDIIVYGGKGNDVVAIDPTVTLPSVLDGGHGGRNRLVAGSTETLEHGWFGHTTMVGGSGPNQMIGRAGQVKFRPTKSTDLIFAGKPQNRTPLLNATPPQGSFFVYKKGKLIAVPLSRLSTRK